MGVYIGRIWSNLAEFMIFEMFMVMAILSSSEFSTVSRNRNTTGVSEDLLRLITPLDVQEPANGLSSPHTH